MKLYLDDQRPAPDGWVLAKTATDAIDLLRRGDVTELSLDYDLGEPASGTGLQVLTWLETAIAEGRVILPTLTAHSGSVVGRRRLEAQIEWLEQRFASDSHQGLSGVSPEPSAHLDCTGRTEERKDLG